LFSSRPPVGSPEPIQTRAGAQKFMAQPVDMAIPRFLY
jgi:hypothetical protein